MKDNNTRQKEGVAHLRSKDSRFKDPHKIAKKSLNAAFTTVSEDVSPVTVKELSDFSATSKASDASVGCQTPQSTLSSLSTVHPAPSGASPISEPFQTPNVSPTSDEPIDVSTNACIFHKSAGSVEVDIISNFLKQARSQVLNSTDVSQQSKKIIDALVKVVLDEGYALPEEREFYSELVSAKGRIIFVCFTIWCFIVYLLFFSGVLDRSYTGPLPT